MQLENELVDFNSFLKEYIDNFDFKDLELKEAVNYSLFPGGKRIRPMIVLAIGLDFNLNKKQIYSIAAAIELLHTSSLIHDDLPALDNDDIRRNKASLHKKFNESTAILTGDYLISLANLVLIDGVPNAEIVKIFNNQFLNLIVGQMLDQRDLNLKDLMRCNELKTSSLFELATTLPIILSNNIKYKNNFKILGKFIGFYFQIYNDFLDINNSALNGREYSSDKKNLKTTVVNSTEFCIKQLTNIHNTVLNSISELKKENELQNFEKVIFKYMKFEENLKTIIN